MIIDSRISSCCRNCLKMVLLYIRRSPNRAYSSTSRKAGITHYDILGVKPDASAKEIRDAFVRLSKQLHPDKNPLDPKNHDKFVKLNEAYSILSKPLSRREYDVSLVARYYLHQNVTANAFGSHKPGSSPSPGSSPNFDSEARQAEFWDETIWHMRNKAKDAHAFYPEDSYYGVKGLRRVPNSYILAGCVVLIGIGTLYFFAGLSWSKSKRDQFLERDKKLSSHLDKVRKRANEIFGWNSRRSQKGVDTGVKKRKLYGKNTRNRQKRMKKRREEIRKAKYSSTENLEYLNKGNTDTKLTSQDVRTSEQLDTKAISSNSPQTVRSQAQLDKEAKREMLNQVDRSSLE